MQTVHDRIFAVQQTLPSFLILDYFCGMHYLQENGNSLESQSGLKCGKSHGQISLQPSTNKNGIAHVHLANSAPTTNPS
jgi:hypothetical protein